MLIYKFTTKNFLLLIRVKISSEFHWRTLMKSSKQTWTLVLKIRLDLVWHNYACVCASHNNKECFVLLVI